MYELLKNTARSPGRVGYEDRIQKQFIKDLKPLVKKVELTNTGNVFAHLPGKGKRVVIFGHADEICYYVRQVTDDGFLKIFGMTGRMDKLGFPYTCVGQKTLVLGDKADARGVLATKSRHLLTETERAKPIEYMDIFVDIDAANKKEVEDQGIHLGSPIIWNPTLERFVDKVFGKAMDDRLAHTIEIKLAEKLKDAKLNCDLSLLQQDIVINPRNDAPKRPRVDSRSLLLRHRQVNN